MNRLVRLYPKAWRDRYEREFLALLEARPPRLLDALDTARGALDAHLHPNLADGDRDPVPWTHRIPGLLALTGALAWVSAVAAIGSGAATPWDPWSLLPGGLMLVALSIPGDYLGEHRRRVAAAIGLLLVCIVGGNAAPEPVSTAFAVIGTLTLFGGLLTAGAIRAGIGANGRWIILAVAIGVPLAPTIPAALAIVDLGSEQPWHLLAMLPYSLAWTLVAARMAIRGTPTIIDPPIITMEPEVRAA
jgi:hypothetical protein